MKLLVMVFVIVSSPLFGQSFEESHFDFKIGMTISEVLTKIEDSDNIVCTVPFNKINGGIQNFAYLSNPIYKNWVDFVSNTIEPYMNLLPGDDKRDGIRNRANQWRRATFCNDKLYWIQHKFSYKVYQKSTIEEVINNLRQEIIIDFPYEDAPEILTNQRTGDTATKYVFYKSVELKNSFPDVQYVSITIYDEGSEYGYSLVIDNVDTFNVEVTAKGF